MQLPHPAACGTTYALRAEQLYGRTTCERIQTSVHKLPADSRQQAYALRLTRQTSTRHMMQRLASGKRRAVLTTIPIHPPAHAAHRTGSQQAAQQQLSTPGWCGACCGRLDGGQQKSSPVAARVSVAPAQHNAVRGHNRGYMLANGRSDCISVVATCMCRNTTAHLTQQNARPLFSLQLGSTP